MLEEQHKIMDGSDKFFDDLGGLHDARIESINWHQAKKQLIITVDDLMSNYIGLPEYSKPVPASITLDNVIAISIAIDPVDNDMSIYNFKLLDDSTKKLIGVVAELTPGGLINLSCKSIRINKRSPGETK